MDKEITASDRCRLHHKDTNFKANHNTLWNKPLDKLDVDCTTKIRILKQITTAVWADNSYGLMSIAPQRYEF